MHFIIFDIDGTLTDSTAVDDDCFVRAFQETFEIGSWNQSWEGLQNVTDWGITEEIFQGEFGRLPSDEEFQRMHDNFIRLLRSEQENHPEKFKEVPGAKEYFNSLKNDPNIGLGVATGSWELSAMVKLNTGGIDIQGVCFSNSDYHKTRAEITQDVIDQLKERTGEEPERIIYFGDGSWDYRTCQLLEIEFIGVDVHLNGKLKALGAERVISSYAGVRLMA
ncbi:MAG: HAD hydrolase-like protein [Flavobacteriales bacterium]|nr:HAD hydrolase-like protein [Flavobacteriales bacterium]